MSTPSPRQTGSRSHTRQTAKESDNSEQNQSTPTTSHHLTRSGACYNTGNERSHALDMQYYREQETSPERTQRQQMNTEEHRRHRQLLSRSRQGSINSGNIEDRTGSTTPRSTRSRTRARQLSVDNDNIEDITGSTTPRSTRSRTRARQLSVDNDNIEDITGSTTPRSTRSRTRARQLSVDNDNIEDRTGSTTPRSTRSRTHARQLSVNNDNIEDRTGSTTPRSTRSRTRARQLSVNNDNIEDRTGSTTPRSTRSRTHARLLSVNNDNIEDRTGSTTPRSTRSRTRARQLSVNNDNIEDRTGSTTPRSTRSRTRARQLSVDNDNIEERPTSSTPRSTRSQTRSRQHSVDSDNIKDRPISTTPRSTRSGTRARQRSVGSRNIEDSHEQQPPHSSRFRDNRRRGSTESDRMEDSGSRAMDMQYHREQETTPERAQRLQLDAEEHRRHRQRSHVEVQMTARQNTNLPGLHFIGAMSLPCTSCGALHFNEETHRPDHSFNVCCNFGKVTVPVFQNYPEQWKTYLTSMESQYTGFRQTIRNFNSALAMASMGAQLDIPDNRKNRGPYCFRIHGQIYHHIGPLHPPEGQQLSYGQIYILDTDMAAEERLRKKDNTKCDPALMAELGVFLSRHNPYAQSYFMMSEIEKKEEETAKREGRSSDPVRLIFDTSLQVDQRRYNLPTANEVAIVFVGKDDDVPPTRSLAVHSRSEGLQIIKDIDKLCDPLTYPILYPTGGYGWHPELRKTAPSGQRTRITQKEYYCYLLHTRTAEFNPLHHSNKLFQQYIVDSWVKTEQNRLNYDRQHQSDLRIDSYKGLQDYMGEDNQEQGPPGRRIVLPASYKGGPRDMQQSYQDAMAIVAHYGKPEYFLTMTCNPHWKEIIEQLNPGQTASDRPDIVARVFQLKVKKLFDCLLKEHILGEVAAYVAVVEFQKRGLPHIHMLIIMKSDYKLRSARDIDSAISAELPDKEAQPELFNIVASCMIHRPCGAHNQNSPCMKDGVCTKKYPKEFRSDTQMDGDSYPKYRRRDDGRFIELKGVRVDNKWVVPYNPYLSSLFGCHINLEVCALIQAVKYLYKYVYKGSDRAALRIVRAADGENVQVFDEISVPDTSALRKLLIVHLENEQPVTFRAGEEAAAVQAAEHHQTNLTSFFAMNQLSEDIFVHHTQPAGDMIDSRDFSYIDMPHHFTFSDHTWKPRKRGEKQLGRMYTVSPKDPERFCLRLLLLHRKGSKSFADLRTVGTTVHSKYIDAAKALGLFNDDRYYAQCMEEATTYQNPAQLRSLFACLIAFTEIREPLPLWERFKEEMSSDYQHLGSTPADSIALCYYDIMDKLIHCGITLSKLIDPPATRPSTPAEVIDVEASKRKGEEMYETLNQSQKEFVDAVLEGADSADNRLFFLDGPGGSGKTYVYTVLNYILCGRNHRILNVAWTGIAANLLPDGRTASSAFKLNIEDSSRSSTMKRQSKEAHLLKEITTVIWDEISMTPKHALDAVNSLLQDIMQNNLEFGGKLMILGGDFRQVLPVIERGREEDIVDATVKKSDVWIHFHTFHLTQNMRLAAGNRDWNSYILHVGDGTEPLDENGCIELPEEIMSSGNLIDEIYGDLKHNFSPSLLAERCILAPKNINVLGINEEVIKIIPGESTTYTSIDEVQADDESTRDAEAMNFPPEFLYSMTPTGMPPHILTLKEGAIVILLKNLDVRNGLCNGSRLIVKQMGRYVLGCEHACGARKGTFVMIPRIDNHYSHTLPFRLCRRQFPLRLAFAMTIHKAQGQSFQKVGIELNDDVFGHGQLYVALSRVRSMDGIKVAAPTNKVKNIVYKDVL